MGYDGSNILGDLWEYDPSTNSWTQKAGLSTGRYLCASFSINNKGYICLGSTTTSAPTIQDVWEYNPASNSWVQKNNFPGTPRYSSATFVINNKAYIACGNQGSSSGPYTNEMWEYNPTNDTWFQKNNFPGVARYGSTALALNNFGYVGLGYSGSFHNDFYMYDPSNDLWTQKTSFPGNSRNYAIGFNVCNKGYIGAGQSNGNPYSDIWEYNYFSNAWTQVSNFGGGNRWVMVACVINNTLYAGTGYDFNNYFNDWWKYSCEGNGIFETHYPSNLSSFYPTVFSSTARLEIDNFKHSDNCHLNIIDVSGKIVANEKIISSVTKIERRGINQGIYSYEVISDGKKIGWGKFIIE